MHRAENLLLPNGFRDELLLSVAAPQNHVALKPRRLLLFGVQMKTVGFSCWKKWYDTEINSQPDEVEVHLHHHLVFISKRSQFSLGTKHSSGWRRVNKSVLITDINGAVGSPPDVTDAPVLNPRGIYCFAPVVITTATRGRCWSPNLQSTVILN